MLYVFGKLCEAVYKNCYNFKASFKIAFLKISFELPNMQVTEEPHYLHTFMNMYRSTNKILKN